jgi:hypothetical protein
VLPPDYLFGEDICDGELDSAEPAVSCEEPLTGRKLSPMCTPMKTVVHDDVGQTSPVVAFKYFSPMECTPEPVLQQGESHTVPASVSCPQPVLPR